MRERGLCTLRLELGKEERAFSSGPFGDVAPNYRNRKGKQVFSVTLFSIECRILEMQKTETDLTGAGHMFGRFHFASAIKPSHKDYSARCRYLLQPECEFRYEERGYK